MINIEIPYFIGYILLFSLVLNTTFSVVNIIKKYNNKKTDEALHLKILNKLWAVNDIPQSLRNKSVKNKEEFILEIIRERVKESNPEQTRYGLLYNYSLSPEGDKKMILTLINKKINYPVAFKINHSDKALFDNIDSDIERRLLEEAVIIYEKNMKDGEH